MAAANAIMGGDEVNAVVVDLGGALCRAGYAGDDAPKAVFPSSVGVVAGTEANGAAAGGGGGEGGAGGAGARSVYIGSEALAYRRERMEIASPFGADDLVADWDLASRVVGYALKDRLRTAPEEMAIMLAEPTHIDRAARERAVEALFESQRCPALYLAKTAVLSAFAMGRQTALVLDAGHRGATVAAVYEGYALNKSVARSAASGALLTRCMQSVLEEAAAAKGAKLAPRHAAGGGGGGSKKGSKAKGGGGGGSDAAGAATTASYDCWCVANIAADAVEALAKADGGGGVAAAADGAAAAGGQALKAGTYELPDGTEVTVSGADRARVADAVFDASALDDFKGVSGDPLLAGGRSRAVWPALIRDAIDGCDGDARREYWGSVVLTGGAALLAGARERLERELSLLAPAGTKVRVASPANPTERRFAAWIGGSIVASLGSFHQLWMSKAEFDEHGAALIHRKSP